VEALDLLPDSDVKAALQELPEDFRMAVYLAMSRLRRTRRSLTIMGTRSGP